MFSLGNSAGTTRYIKITDFDSNGDLHNKKCVYVDNVSIIYTVKKGDILLGRVGTIGKSYLHKREDMAFSDNLIRVRLNNNLILPKFVYYYTLSRDFYHWKNAIYSISTIPSISAHKYSNLEIPCPDLETQKSIVAYCTNLLETIISLRKIQATKLKLLDKQKQALISDVYNKVTEKVRLKHLISEPLIIGATGGEFEGTIRIVRIADINNYGYLNDKNCLYLFDTNSNPILQFNDVLFAKDGATAGKSYIHKLNERLTFANTLLRARFNQEKILPDYVYLYTNTSDYNNWKNNQKVGIAIPHINIGQYLNLELPYTNLKTQQSIVDYCSRVVSTINEAKEVITQKLQELEKLKESLISEVVTGQIDVRNVVVPEYSFSQLENFADVDDSEDEESDSTAQDFTEDQDVD